MINFVAFYAESDMEYDGTNYFLCKSQGTELFDFIFLKFDFGTSINVSRLEVRATAAKQLKLTNHH